MIIISPSGKFYGSEQVLFDYLTNSNVNYSIFVAEKDLFYTKLKKTTRFKDVTSFSNIRVLYFKMLLFCIFSKVKTIYINEAGHNKYIILLAKLFPRIRFIIHIRLLEDTSFQRWPSNISKNVTILVISKYVKNHFRGNSTLLYDPYPFNDKNALKIAGCAIGNRPFIVGVVGRIAITKGIDNILALLRSINHQQLTNDFHFRFFGDIDNDILDTERYQELKRYTNVEFKGYLSEKDNIYHQIDCVVHGTSKEPLGRIFLEALDFGIPLLGINEGGIGEIAQQVGLTHLLIEDVKSASIGDIFLQKLVEVKGKYLETVREVHFSRQKAKQIFSLDNYTNVIDRLVEL